jgi:hypothetical protein
MRTLPLIVLTLCAAGCADEMPRDVQEATTPPSAEAVPDSYIDEPEPGPLPPGGWADWIADLRSELPRVVRIAATDRGEALDAVQLLQAARQQPLREHFGEGGSAFATDALAQAVERVDVHFQELMRQLAGTDVPQERVQETLDALLQALAEVEAEGTAAGLPSHAPRQ